MTIFEIVKARTVFDIARKRLFTEDKHSGDKIGTVRRWESDGKLHVKKAHGWEVLQNGKEYELKEHNTHKSSKDVRKITQQTEFDTFVEKLFNSDYKNAPTVVRLPKLNKGLLKTLGLNENTQFIFKARYPHISPVRKVMENQSLTKEEYRQIPNAVKNAKTAYIDKEKGNFFISFADKNNSALINKLVFNKTPKGNYLVTLGKVNKVDELSSRKILLVSGRS